MIRGAEDRVNNSNKSRAPTFDTWTWDTGPVWVTPDKSGWPRLTTRSRNSDGELDGHRDKEERAGERFRYDHNVLWVAAVHMLMGVRVFVSSSSFVSNARNAGVDGRAVEGIARPFAKSITIIIDIAAGYESIPDRGSVGECI